MNIRKWTMAAALCPLAAKAAAPQRITDAWYAHNATMVMLGASDRIVATVVSPKRFAWMYRVAPSLRNAEVINTTTMNGEELLRLRSDLVYVTASGHAAAGLRAVGLHVVEVGFDRFDGLLACVTDTAAQLQDDRAKRQADAYREAFTKQLAATDAHWAGVVPRVLHVASLHPLQVDGDRSIIDAWIRHAGGRNAAQGVHGNKQSVTIEQVLSWNPDVVIMGADAGNPLEPGRDPVWRRIRAVREGRVYRNPAGVFNWDRYSPELLLQLEWAREILQGGHVDRDRMVGEIRDFYARFYHYPLNTADAERILEARSPE